MMYLLDTNTCIRYLNQRSPAIIARFHTIHDEDVALCSVVKGELYLGAMKSQFPDLTLRKQEAFMARFISLPFDDHAAVQYARVRAFLEVAGTPIGSNDLMIAAIALANDLTLITHNTREFERVTRLKWEDWEINSQS